MIVVALLTEYCTRLLVESKLIIEEKTSQNLTKPLSFQMIGHYCLGKFGYYSVVFFLLFSQIGFGSAYTIFIATNSNDIYPFLQDNLGASVAIWVLLWFPLLLLICWIKDMKSLALTSILGEIALAFGVVYIMGYSFFHSSETREPTSLAIYSTFPVLFGTAVSAFEGIGVIIPIHDSMRHPQEFRKTLSVNYIICFFVYCGFGLSVYLAYGSFLRPLPTITAILPPTILTAVVKLSISFALLCSYPIQMFTVFEILENELGWVSSESRADKYLDIERNMMRAFVVTIASGLAVLVPNFQNFMGLVGAVGCSMLGFTLPALFYWNVCPVRSISVKIGCCSIIIFSFVTMILSSYLNLVQLFGSL
eukprot:TRINITY_DN3360_c0_g1_i3.p1 TRINITY_DN3360_c0_g1~~TRINITY_DN3360_c0_g1_i3.p1  ORF type:complete len:364 (-),score=46.12 TRINITY_DN3360_c0_g1_i3:56-1147(-)